MELTQLRYFGVVAETESVTVAANQLLVSASAVSRAVTSLERELGLPLFTREGRVIRLNTFGDAFAASVRELLSALDRSVDVVRESAGLETGVASLGFLTSLGAEVVPAIIARHRASHPDVSYRLRQSSGRGVVADLLDGSTDLALSVEDVFPEPRLAWSALYVEQLVLVVSAQHRLAGRRRVRAEELTGEQFVALSSEFTLRQIVDGLFRDRGLDAPRVVFEGSDVATLRGLISGRIGIGILPRDHRSRDDPNLVEIEVREPGCERTISLGWVRDRYLSPAALAFRSGILAHFSLPSRRTT